MTIRNLTVITRKNVTARSTGTNKTESNLHIEMRAEESEKRHN